MEISSDTLSAKYDQRVLNKSFILLGEQEQIAFMLKYSLSTEKSQNVREMQLRVNAFTSVSSRPAFFLLVKDFFFYCLLNPIFRTLTS